MKRFTIWQKQDPSTPGKLVVVSEHPHRDVLIGYHQIEVADLKGIQKAINKIEELAQALICGHDPEIVLDTRKCLEMFDQIIFEVKRLRI